MLRSMKTFTVISTTLFLSAAAFGQSLRIYIKGELAEGSFNDPRKATIFQGQILVPPGQSREVFSAPYSIKLAVAENSSDSMTISAGFFGLGPDFKTFSYTMHAAIGDTIFTPPLPVRDSTLARYTFAFLDDTTQIDEAEPPPDDTTAWGVSESVHYRTHWLSRSLADYMWNLKMGYLEQIYDRHRHSFSLSSSEKIDLVFHPQPTNRVYLDPNLHYSLSPRLLRMDVVYGHDVDALSPRPAIELLLYREWGYGPYWMVSGFGGYYSDNFLQLRKLADSFSAPRLAALLADETWVDSDSGRIAIGGFVRWLLENNTITRFMSLYKTSTVLDFQTRFQGVYGRSIESALGDFLGFAKEYRPQKGELEYYASLYMDQGNYKQAREYLEEIVNGQEPERQKFRNTLAICQFWMGDYSAAHTTLGPNPFSPNCSTDILGLNLGVASGVLQPQWAYRSYAYEEHCGEAIVNLATYCLDEGVTAEAESVLALADDNSRSTPEYMIAHGRLNLMKGLGADSELKEAANMALSRAQRVIHDPVNYLVAGQAYLLLGDYDKARENLETSYFLERRPYFQGCTLLELGKLADLQGKRDEARERYNLVQSIDAGAYEKSLAQGYLKRRFTIKP